MNTETMTKMIEVFGQLGDGAQSAFVTWVIATQLVSLAKVILICGSLLAGAKLVIWAVASYSENAACLRWLGKKVGVNMGDEIYTKDRAALKEAMVRRLGHD